MDLLKIMGIKSLHLSNIFKFKVVVSSKWKDFYVKQKKRNKKQFVFVCFNILITHKTELFKYYPQYHKNKGV